MLQSYDFLEHKHNILLEQRVLYSTVFFENIILFKEARQIYSISLFLKKQFNPMKDSIYYLILLFSVIGLYSCDKQEDRSVKDAALSLVTNQEDIVNYGYVDVSKIIDKGELEKVDVLGPVIKNNLNGMKSAINIDDRLYFALSGPYDKDGKPSKVIGLAKIVNKDSVQTFFSEMGFMFEEEENKLVYYDMSTAIGIDDNFVVFVTADFQGDPKGTLMEAFKNINDKDKDGKIADILNEDTDILMAANLSNLYATSNTSLQNLPKEQKKEIAEMVKGSHISAQIHFNPGNLTLDINTSRVSQTMKDAYFFKSTGAEKAASSIGPGKPILGMATALDIAKMEKFINRFSPGAAKEVYGSLGIGGFFLQAMGSEGIASLVNGDIGMNLTGIDAEEMMYGGLPVFNAYVGLGSNGDNLKDLIHTYSEEGTFEDLGDGYYRMNSAILHAKNDALILHSNDSLKERFIVSPVEKRIGMENFGNKPLFIYADFKQVEAMELPLSKQAKMFVELTEYGTVEGDNEGISIKLNMKNSTDNALKQAVEKAVDQFANQISNISI